MTQEKKKKLDFGSIKKTTVGWLKGNVNSFISYAGLVLCVLLFSILSPIIRNVNIFDVGGLAFRNIMQSAIIYGVIAVGAVFVYSLGAMDISIGAQMSLYCVLMVRIYNVAGSNAGAMLLGILVVLVIALICTKLTLWMNC